MSHYRDECVHGQVYSQCRCMSPNKIIRFVPCRDDTWHRDHPDAAPVDPYASKPPATAHDKAERQRLRTAAMRASIVRAMTQQDGPYLESDASVLLEAYCSEVNDMALAAQPTRRCESTAQRQYREGNYGRVRCTLDEGHAGLHDGVFDGDVARWGTLNRKASE